MLSKSQPKVLIATAGFGDGHNSAARNLQEALKDHAEVEITDPCELGAPTLNKYLKTLYRFVTTHLPKTWHRIYLSTEKRDFNKSVLPFMRNIENALEARINAFQPDLIVSTYPLYPYSLSHIYERSNLKKVPLVTIVTDSLNINAAWRNAPSDYWLVTDQWTRQALINHGLSSSQVIETGFAVSPQFPQLEKNNSTLQNDRLKVLFFPTSRKPYVRRVARELLAHPQIDLTIVLGRNLRKLYSRAAEIKKAHPDRVTLKGWTRKVPQLICQHHLILGKAGGATVHEAIAGQCPMWIHHLVPGQEEGNLQLLKKLHGGALIEDEKQLLKNLENLLKNDAQEWHRMKRSLQSFSRAGGATTAAQFILTTIKKNNQSERGTP